MNSDIRNFTKIRSIMEEVIDHGVGNLVPALELLLNEAMKLERDMAVGAKSYERTESRKGYANGFKERNYQSSVGSLKLQIPQARGLSFYPQCLEKGERSEKALKLAIAEMYVQGVSTRKVSAITEELCGMEVSSSQVSSCAKLLDEELDKFRKRPLRGKYAYVYLDAEYEKIRHDGSVIEMATLIAIGVNEKGMREVLSISSRLSEAEVHWREFLLEMQKRGLSGLSLIISDAHEGLKAARRAVFPSVKWQRCQFHMSQNAQSYCPKKSMKEDIALSMRKIFQSPDYETAQEQKRKAIEKYAISAPQFTNWLENNIEEGLTCFSFPENHQKRIRTTNGLERVNREIKRRTRVVTLFPNVASSERLITSVLQGIHEEWLSGSQYLDMNLLK